MLENLSLREFIAASPLAVVVVNEDGRIVEANRSFHVLTQHTLPDPPSGIRLTELVSEGQRAETEAALQKALKGEETNRPQALEFTLPGGNLMMLSVYTSVIRRPEGNMLIVQFVDTTEQKNLELKFAHSQKMQAVGQLAGGVAHDFNNLLTAMIGFCDLLLMRHPAGDQSFADIMQIKQNANRAANLVRQLLAFSRRQTLQPKLLDITDVLAELSNLVRRLIGENIELKMIHGRDLSAVKADQGQLEQVIINLAVNARDAMRQGGTLNIKTAQVTLGSKSPLPRGQVAPAEEDSTIPNGQYVLVEVADTGTGIKQELLQKIFEPFFSTKEVGSGTGLGLSTVYGIVKQTGGYIFVGSREGQGTTFSIYFPAQQGAAAPLAEAPESTDKSAGQDLTGRGTILLVEDETPVRIFAARALRNKGYTVLEADCGETALEIMGAQGKEVELIVTDVIMPGMNGPAMVEKILENFPEMKVIFVSGYAEDVFVSSYGAERSFNFLAKPFTLKQLAGKVKDVVGAKMPDIDTLTALLHDPNGPDSQLFIFINFHAYTGCRHSWCDQVMVLGSWIGNSGNLGLYAGLLGLFMLWRLQQKGAQPPAYYLLQLIVFCLGCALAVELTSLLKDIFQIARPYVAWPVVRSPYAIMPESEAFRSFPSGHATFATAVAASLWPLCSRRAQWLLGFCVLWVCWSRIAMGVHFPSDLLAGCAVGMGAVIGVRQGIARYSASPRGKRK